MRSATWEKVMTVMPCPVCGRSDGLCDCLLQSARGKVGDSAPAPGHGSAGVPGGAQAGIDVDAPVGLNGQVDPGVPEAGAGSDWADSLLQFVRDFASASPKAAPASAGQPGRNQSVGRGPAGPGTAHLGAPGHQELEDGAVHATSVAYGVVGACETEPEPPMSSAGPVRVAPFVGSQIASGDQAASPARPAPAAPRSGAANGAWSGGEFECPPAAAVAP
jgi:hypothetical protein